MSRALHHGENGSYKTAGALNDFLIDAVKAGRPVISNVRGLTSKEKIKFAVFKSHNLKTQIYWSLFPDKQPIWDFDLYYLDTEDKIKGEENIEQMRCFYHWAPVGALIIFDEVDDVFDPQEFTAKKQREYDYPEAYDDDNKRIRTSRENANFNDRPAELKRAFSKHRHWKWDIVTTSVDISLVHPMIIKGADNGFRHINMANVIGFLGKGKYRELSHHPKKAGMSADAKSTRTRKIPSYMFNIYESTKDEDSKVQDTIAGTSILNNTRLKVLFSIIGISAMSLTYTHFIKGELNASAADTGQTNKQETKKQTTFFEDVAQKANYSTNKANNKNPQIENSHVSNSNLQPQIPISDTQTNDDLIAKHFFDSLKPVLIFMGKPYKGISYFRTHQGIRVNSLELAKFNIKVKHFTNSTGVILHSKDVIHFNAAPLAKPNNYGSLLPVKEMAKNTIDKIK